MALFPFVNEAISSFTDVSVIAACTVANAESIRRRSASQFDLRQIRKMWLRFLLVLSCSLLVAARHGFEGTNLRFVDVTSGSGIGLENVSGSPTKTAIPESLGQGAAALDYNGDGKLDLFIVNGDMLPGSKPRVEPRPALYRNEGNLRFTDVTVEAGLLFRAWAHGAYAVDFDADGHTDLYITVFGGPNRFFRNRGDGTFEDMSEEWGGADRGPSTCAAFFDADGDGDLDLYVCNYVLYDPKNPPNKGRPCTWKGLSVFCGPIGTPAAPDNFYENRNGRLIEASERFGFRNVRASYALGAVTGDFDNDGDVDLYIANDSQPNYLFVNLGGGHFREAGLEYGVALSGDGRAQAGMGVDFGDIDNDGRFEFFKTNFSHDTNTLYHNEVLPDGGTTFIDTTFEMKLAEPSFSMLSWGTRFVDLDLDGWQDIVVVSGHVYPQVDQAEVGTTYRQVNQIFHNLGVNSKGIVTFSDVGAAAGEPFAEKAVSRGLVVADFDNDGDQDLLVVRMDNTPRLIRNDTESKGHWIGFELIGEGKNRGAIGTRLSVEDSSGIVRWRECSSGGSYLSTGDPRITVGLGSAGGKIRKLHIRWPSGKTSVYENLQVNRYWSINAESKKVFPF